ncbi:MAG: GNAT family N-acetyltransferase [Verrucomicrobiota bacterium]
MLNLLTPRLTLVLQSMEDIRAMIAGFPPEVRAQLSPVWLEQVAAATEATPWVHGFSLHHRVTGLPVGSVGFKGPPSTDGLVEIAYQVYPDHQGQGYATEAAAALTAYAFSDDRVRTVCAHTLPELNASAQVLTKCGFTHLGEVIDPEDGLVWRWEKTRAKAI